MDWRGKIVSDKNVLAGKPIIKGTRLSVEFLLGLFANAWQEEEVLKIIRLWKKKIFLQCLPFAQDELEDELSFESKFQK